MIRRYANSAKAIVAKKEIYSLIYYLLVININARIRKKLYL